MFKEVSSVMSEKEFEKHFTPPYNPWEQRFCLAPGGDFFAPIRSNPLALTGALDILVIFLPLGRARRP